MTPETGGPSSKDTTIGLGIVLGYFLLMVIFWFTGVKS